MIMKIDENTRRFAADTVRDIITKAQVEYKARQLKIKQQECLRAFAKRAVDNVLDLVSQKVKNKAQTECVEKSRQTVSDPEIPSSLDREKIAPYKHFIRLSGLKTDDGSEIILVDPSALPRKKTFKKLSKGSKATYSNTMQSLCSYAEYFIDTKVKNDAYTVLVHATNDSVTRDPGLKWTRAFYDILANSSGTLNKCFITKATRKLKAAVILTRPFMRPVMRNKFHLVKDVVKDFCAAQGLPESFISM